MKKYLMISAMCLLASVCLAQKTYEQPDVHAVFPGGLDAMVKFLSSNLNYNNMDVADGRAVMCFVVETDGSIAEIKAEQSPSEKVTAEATRVIKMMPKWTPATVDGKPIRELFHLPIKISSGKEVKHTFANYQDAIAQCDKIAKEGVGHKEDPKGLYGLLSLHADNRKEDIIPSYVQYKYCGDSLTLTLYVTRDIENSGDKDELNFRIYDNDNMMFKYTGDLDNKGMSVFDSNDKTFKLKWYNNKIPNSSVFPYKKYTTELYSSELADDPRMKHAMDMMQGKFSGTNKFTGCWHRLGVVVKVDDMDMLLPGHQELYMLLDKETFLQYYDLIPGRLSGFCVLRPVTYLSDNSFKQLGGANDVEWLNDDNFKLTFDRGDGVMVTELWKRAGLPNNIQRIFGTHFPTYKINNPLPNYFTSSSDK